MCSLKRRLSLRAQVRVIYTKGEGDEVEKKDLKTGGASVVVILDPSEYSETWKPVQ